MNIRSIPLQSFDEPVDVCDPTTRTRCQDLAVSCGKGNPSMKLLAPMHLRQSFRVDPEQGAAFVAATDDPNGIHTVGDVVPGAYLWAKVLLGLEVLIPRLEILEIKTRFTSITHYGQNLLSELHYQPQDDGKVGIEVKILRAGEVVSSAVIHGRLRETSGAVDVQRSDVNNQELQRVTAFCRSVGVDPDAYFYKSGETSDFSYPCSFIASLPSGALVRSLNGDGGVLGSLKLSFLADCKRPIVGPGPEVTVQRPRRWRKTFNRIMTAIKEGVVTYLQGSALVASIQA